MNFIKLFELLREKGFHYFTGNNSKNILDFDFSSGYNGRGKSLCITNFNLKENKFNLEFFLEENQNIFIDITFEEVLNEIKKL